MNTSAKLNYHFDSKPIAWVPMWGISKLRKRGGGFAGAIEGKATYYDKWYDRAMSEDTAKKLADMGVNLVILPFSIGGNAKIEAGERDDFQRMTSYLHKYGIVSLPYFQYQNILQEASELQDSEWAVNLDGTRRQFAYWRRTVCQSSRSFIDYVKGLVADAVERGADGIWIDNTYLAPCRCPLCETNFRKYLSSERNDLLDLLYLENFDNVEIPFGLPDKIQEPIMQAYVEFNCQRNTDILSEIKQKLEELLPSGLFASNPALGRGRNMYAMGMDIYEQGKLHDILYLENKLCPKVEDNFISGNFHGFISFSDLDCATVAGSWKGNLDFDSTVSTCSSGMPDTADEVAKLIFEGKCFNNISGMFWAVRSRYHGICETPEQLMQMHFEKEDINTWMQESLSTVKKTNVPKDMKNMAKTGIFHSRSSLAFAHSTAHASLFCMEEMLLRNRIPYQILYSEELANISDLEMVIIPECLFMSDQEAQIIEDYVKSGGKLLVIGDSGLHDEYGFIREDYVLNNASGVSYFDRPKTTVFNCIGKGKTAFFHSTGKSERTIPYIHEEHKMPAWVEHETVIIAALDELNEKGRQIIIDSDEHIGVSLFGNSDGDVIISLMSYEDSSQKENIKLSIRSDIASSTSAKWISCGEDIVSVKAVDMKDGYNNFLLNDFSRYGSLILK